MQTNEPAPFGFSQDCISEFGPHSDHTDCEEIIDNMCSTVPDDRQTASDAELIEGCNIGSIDR